MTRPTDDPAAKLRAVFAKYEREKKRAAAIAKAASAEVAEEIRAAYDNGNGMKKADILRAINHKWSRTWVDRACKGEDINGTTQGGGLTDD